MTMIKQLREDPVTGRPDLFTRVDLDSAGEWGPFNAEFHNNLPLEPLSHNATASGPQNQNPMA
jgi:hypothetical protein